MDSAFDKPDIPTDCCTVCENTENDKGRVLRSRKTSHSMHSAKHIQNKRSDENVDNSIENDEGRVLGSRKISHIAKHIQIKLGDENVDNSIETLQKDGTRMSLKDTYRLRQENEHLQQEIYHILGNFNNVLEKIEHDIEEYDQEKLKFEKAKSKFQRDVERFKAWKTETMKQINTERESIQINLRAIEHKEGVLKEERDSLEDEKFKFYKSVEKEKMQRDKEQLRKEEFERWKEEQAEILNNERNLMLEKLKGIEEDKGADKVHKKEQYSIEEEQQSFADLQLAL